MTSTTLEDTTTTTMAPETTTVPTTSTTVAAKDDDGDQNHGEAHTNGDLSRQNFTHSHSRTHGGPGHHGRGN